MTSQRSSGKHNMSDSTTTAELQEAESEGFVVIEEDLGSWGLDSPTQGDRSPEQSSPPEKPDPASALEDTTSGDKSVRRKTFARIPERSSSGGSPERQAPRRPERSVKWSDGPDVEKSVLPDPPTMNDSENRNHDAYLRPRSDLRFCNACEFRLGSWDITTVLRHGYWYHEDCLKQIDDAMDEVRYDCEQRRSKSKRLHTRIRKFFTKMTRKSF